jgi:hypothetical protein
MANNLDRIDNENLTEALNKLYGLIDVSSDSRCTVAPEHKQAVKLYVESWIIPALEEIKNRDTDSLDTVVNFSPYGQDHTPRMTNKRLGKLADEWNQRRAAQNWHDSNGKDS